MGATPPTLEALNQFASAENLALNTFCGTSQPDAQGWCRAWGAREGRGVPQQGQRQFQCMEGKVHVLSHLLCAPGAKPSPPMAPHRAPCIPLSIISHWHNSQCIPVAGAWCRSSAQGSGCLQEPCALPKEPATQGTRGNWAGDPSLYPGATAKSSKWEPQPQGAGSDASARREAVEETKDRDKPWLVEGDHSKRWPHCGCGDLAAGPAGTRCIPARTRCIPAHRFVPTLNHARCKRAQQGGAGGQPGDKPALFLKHSSRLGFSYFDLERRQMDLNWLLSQHGWGEARQRVVGL